jgi:hypothetical protein
MKNRKASFLKEL